MTLLYDVNTIPTTGTIACFNLKTLIKSAGWVVKSSGDGSAIFSSTTDIITQSSSGANGLGNTNAWFRIQSPDLTREFVFQRGSSDLLWRIKYSAGAKFTGGAPNATTFPTATDEQYVLGTSGSFVGWHTTNNTYRYHICASNADGYGFWATGVQTGTVSSTMSGAIMFDPLVAGSYETQEPDPFVIYAPTTGSNWTAGTLTSTSTGAGTWNRYGFTDATFAVVMAHKYVLTAPTPIMPLSAGVDLFTGKQILMPVFWIRNASASVNPGIIKGKSFWLMWHGLTISTGTSLSVSANFDRLVLGDVSFPWNGSLVLV